MINVILRRQSQERATSMLWRELKRDDIVCFFFSEHEEFAMEQLGFDTQVDCFDFLSVAFPPRPASSFRRLRDEFDALTSSRRVGQHLREPASRVKRAFDSLKDVPRAKLLEYVLEQIDSSSVVSPRLNLSFAPEEAEKEEFFEREIDEMANMKDDSASFYYRTKGRKIRKYNVGILRKLKEEYQGQCQLCGAKPFAGSGSNADITECHHIDYFAASQNNDAENIIILCPNHHRLLHKESAVFEREQGRFVLSNGQMLPIKLDMHLSV